MPSVLWHCWLGGRKSIRPVKNWVVRCWHGCLSGVRCRLAYARLMPLPLTVSCFSKIQIGFTFLVPAHPGNPGKRAVKRVCVRVRSCVCVYGYILLGVMKSIEPVKIEWWDVVVWSEVQIVCIWSSWCHCHPKTPSSLASFKARLVFPFLSIPSSADLL